MLRVSHCLALAPHKTRHVPRTANLSGAIAHLDAKPGRVATQRAAGALVLNGAQAAAVATHAANVCVGAVARHRLVERVVHADRRFGRAGLRRRLAGFGKHASAVDTAVAGRVALQFGVDVRHALAAVVAGGANHSATHAVFGVALESAAGQRGALSQNTKTSDG